MDDPTSDIHDWELILQPEDDEAFINTSSSSLTSAAEVAADKGGVIHSDYFTLDPHHQHTNYVGGGDTAAAAVSESSCEDSDNPSWVDPSDSSVAGGAGRKRSRSPDSYSSSSKSSNVDASEGEGQHLQHEVVSVVDDGVLRFPSEEERDIQAEAKEERKVVWWKVPMEVLRYCVMKVGPVWSLSVAAAAVMGLMILRRRYLYRLKRKTQGIGLKVTVDDKKVSQFMTRAARLNEAFSVVKRVPIIRPALPAPGMVPWPVMSMR